VCVCMCVCVCVYVCVCVCVYVCVCVCVPLWSRNFDNKAAWVGFSCDVSGKHNAYTRIQHHVVKLYPN